MYVCNIVSFRCLSNSFSTVSEAYMIGDVQIDDLDAVMEVRYFSFRKLADFFTDTGCSCSLTTRTSWRACRL